MVAHHFSHSLSLVGLFPCSHIPTTAVHQGTAQQLTTSYYTYIYAHLVVWCVPQIVRWCPNPPFSSFAHMPGLPCPVDGCRGWTNTRRGQWYNIPLDFSLELNEQRATLHQRVCNACWNRHVNRALPIGGRARVNEMVAAVEPPSTPITPAFFLAHLHRTRDTDLVLLGRCGLYLDAVIDMVTDVVGLDLAPDSLDSTRILDTPSCKREHWAAVLRADNRVLAASYTSCAVGGLSAEQTVFDRCAMGQPQVYLDYVVFPLGPVCPGSMRMGGGGREEEVA